MNGLDLSDLALFALVVSAGSLAAAEVATGVPKATLSRSMLRLEAAAGSALFDRLPRGLRPPPWAKPCSPRRARRATFGTTRRP
jgi:DNA-binding transcriptional LysR family regulator